MNRIFHILLPFFLLLFLADCAKIGAPVGGPRDEDPPVIEKSKPQNHAVNFEGDQIEITFDEFIKTDAISQEMLVSPPLEERPEIRLRSKTLVIEWFEELHDSTTYTFSFGESIADLNEGNVLRNFEFVFSTGGHLDSLGVLGTVVKAFDLEPHEEKIYLMLYSNPADSAPLKEIPDYVGQADEKGNFLINNLKPDTYRLFALQDLNRNYKYDVPEEFIGFVDSAFLLNPSLFETILSEEKDSLLTFVDSIGIAATDSLRTGPDSLELLKLDAYLDDLKLAIAHGDSIILTRQDSLLLGFKDSQTLAEGDTAGFAAGDSAGLATADSSLLYVDDSLTLADLAPWSIFVDVYLFQEDNRPQYLIDNTRQDRRKIEIRFNRRVTDTLKLEPYNFEAAEDWFIFEEHVMNDTFVYWITDSLVYKRDSLTFLATYLATDTLNQLSPFYDTLKFNYRAPVKKTSRRKRDSDEAVDETEKITVSPHILGSKSQDLYRPLPIEIQHPVSVIDTTRMRFIRLEDTLEIPEVYSVVRDEFKLRRYWLEAEWKDLTTYRLNLYPGAFTDIYGLTHDTLTMQFNTQDPEYYSRILLNLTGVRGQKIIQFLDDKKKVYRSILAEKDGIIEIDYLPPSSFTLKLIHDDNADGIWTTGDYLGLQQPEKVEFHPGQISLRSNFDMEITWKLEPEDN